MAEWVAARNVDDVLHHAKIQLGPDLIGRTRQRIAPYDLGVELLDHVIVSAEGRYYSFKEAGQL